MRRTLKLPWLAVGGCVIVVLLLAVIGRVTGAPEAHAEASSATPSTQPTYSVLNRAPQSGDQALGRPVTTASLSRLDPTLVAAGARLLSTDKIAVAIAIPRTDGSTCLARLPVAGGASVTCSSATNPVPMLMNYGRSVALMPDGVSSVTLSMTDGSSVGRTVTGNVMEAPADAASLRYSYDGRTVEVDLMPLSDLPKNAVVNPDGSVSLPSGP